MKGLHPFSPIKLLSHTARCNLVLLFTGADGHTVRDPEGLQSGRGRRDDPPAKPKVGGDRTKQQVLLAWRRACGVSGGHWQCRCQRG
jgi:hypothetical protein